MKLLIKSTLLILLTSVIVFSSCKDYLDVDKYFDDEMKYDSIFHSKLNLERYMWGVASSLPDESRIFGEENVPGITASDEIFTLMTDDLFKGRAFSLGKVTADDQKGLGVWGTLYKVIRKTNLILGRMDECVDMTAQDKRQFLAYTHFIRGYAYYQLMMAYGPVIIMEDDVYPNNEKAEFYNRGRNTFDETVEYICSELETAAEYLPKEVATNYFGRPTQGAAYALIARVRLHAASPAFNGGDVAKRYFGGWTRTQDGEHYVSLNYDEKKWALAAAAAKRVIDMGLYELHTVDSDSKTPPLPANVPSENFPNGAGGIDHLKSYADMFNGESFPSKNQEFIFAKESDQVKKYTQQSFPVYMGGYSGMGVTQKVVDAYRMENGKTIQEAEANGEYTEAGFTDGAKSFSDYTLRSGVSNMYNNREMRFYASIGFSECFWSAASTSNGNVRNQTVTYYLNGNSGVNAKNQDPLNFTPTGYVLKKYIHSDDAWTGDGSSRIDKAFPIIRYAEILLSYAEALNNLTKSYTIEMASGESYTVSRTPSEIALYFNRVRYRAGLPGLTTTELESRTEIFNLIVNERLVEFLSEGRRFYDIRRWGIYEQEENMPIVGMNVMADKTTGFYTRTTMSNYADYRNRVVDRRLMFLPLSREEVRKASLLDQNPGYAN